MSDLCLSEFEDIVWDEICCSDDHMVPLSDFDRPDDHSTLDDSHKKPCLQITSISNNNGDRSGTGYADKGREQRVFSAMSKRRNTMLEKDSWSHAPSDEFPAPSGSDSIKEVSSLDFENTASPSHVSNNTEKKGSEFCDYDTLVGDKTAAVGKSSVSYPIGDISHADNNFSLFDNMEDKDSSDFFYYDWPPEIRNFEDVDRMFRSCDSTFELGVSKEEQLGWLISADNTEGPGDVLGSDFKFPNSEANTVEKISENYESLESYSINDSAITTAPVSYKDTSWTLEKPDSPSSFVNGRAKADKRDGFIHEKQIKVHRRQFKLQDQSLGKRKDHYFGNGSFSYMNNQANKVVQLPSVATYDQALLQKQVLSPDSSNYLQNPHPYVHNSHLSGQTSVNPTLPSVKSETDDLISLSPRDSTHTSNPLQSMESSHDPPFQVTAAGSGKREKLHYSHGSRSSVSSNLQNASETVQGAKGDPVLIGRQVQYYRDKVENHSDIEGINLVVPGELGSSNIQESSTMSSGMDDISLEAASFRQLQLVMEQLDLRTKLCIRDSLYRLARSAEQRHNHANFHVGSGDERDASGAFVAEGRNNFMDMETNTNPIDRSIAHLLFHRPSESSAVPAHDLLPFKSPNVVRGSITSMPVMAENLVNCEETASDMEKVSDS